MTVLALMMSRRANAVSALHGEVFRAMWTELFPGRPEESRADRTYHERRTMFRHGWLLKWHGSTIATSVPNGVDRSSDPRTWEKIENVDDGELWETHLSLKSDTRLEFVRSRAVDQCRRRGESQATLQKLSRAFSPDALTIGFARRLPPTSGLE
jgi:starch phosphorylase